MNESTAIAHPNFALIKYWGKRDVALNLPAVSSLSLTVNTFFTKTQVRWGSGRDAVFIDRRPADAPFSARALTFLSKLCPSRPPCEVYTENNFPVSAGLASSASGFAALAFAANTAGQLNLSRDALSALTRQGSGSACRSLYGGLVQWSKGSRPDGQDSIARPLPNTSDWPIAIVVAIVSSEKKQVGSTEGMLRSERTSPFYSAWVSSAEDDFQQAKQAIARRDLSTLGELMEHSTLKMHSTMHTARPPIHYWRSATVACMQEVRELRQRGVPCWFTMDAGPNVKVLCQPKDTTAIKKALSPHVTAVHVLGVGEGARTCPR